MGKEYFFNHSTAAKEGQFIGRTYEKEYLLKRIYSGFKFSIYGQRRIGKTSLAFEIKRILENDKEEKERLFGEDIKYKVIYCDCGTVYEERDMWRKMINELEPSYDLRNFNKVDIVEFEKMLFKNEEKILFIWDEFEIMARNKNIKESFYNFFRGITNTSPKVNIMVIGKNSIFDIESLYDHLIGSPFFNIFTSFNLKGLTSEESKKLLKLGLGDNEDVKKSIIELIEYAGKSPYYLNLIGNICLNYTCISENLDKIKKEFYLNCKSIYAEILKNYDLYYYSQVFNAIFNDKFIPDGKLKRRLIEENIIVSEEDIECTSKALQQYIVENISI